MAKFLEQVADFIIENIGKDGTHTAVIFPNKRSEVFLKNHLKKRVSDTFWLPDFLTVDEFIVNSSGITELEPVNLYFELYKIHKNIAGSKARTLDDFLAWAPVMLSDFNDIDLYLADAKAIFKYLTEVRAIEAWNPGKPLTDLQTNYLAFYNSLEQYYSDLTKNLSKNGYGFKGMIYRHMLKNIENISNEWMWKRFILVGFNALSLAEREIFGYLHRHFKVDALFDVDEYYFSDNSTDNNEAGAQIKALVNEWKIDKVNWTSNNLKTDQKQVNVLGIPKRIGQVKYASQIIEKWANTAIQKAKDENENNASLDIAVVLADEKLLVPFLHSLPEIVNTEGGKIPFNITMGYPLKNSGINEFINNWLNLLDAVNTSVSDLFPVKNILELFNNAFFRSCFDYYSPNKAQLILSALFEKNASYISKQDVLNLEDIDNTDQSKLLNILFSTPVEPSGFIDLLTDFLITCKPAIDKSENNNPILREQFILIVSLIKKIKVLLEDIKPDLSYRAIEKVMGQIMSRSEINLKGEPLTGIQVMGMLETRTLDFKNLIILSANDGILPKTESIESFIPFDIRRDYNLPLPKDKTDIYAYHFFRLMQRAKNINLIYNSEPDALGGGEKSRFILQLEEELKHVNPLINITQNQVNIQAGDKSTKQQISIKKTPEVAELIDRRLTKGLSPTSLTSFINCPLQFYFKYILGLKAPDILESSIEANVMGTVIHGVLEDFYEKFINKPIDSDLLQVPDNKIKQLVLNKFKEEFKGGDITSGQNLLIVEVAIQYIKKYLKSEVADLSKVNRVLLSTEDELEAQVNYQDRSVKLRGVIDRTDQVNGTDHVRIIDYKTGKVEKRDLVIKDWDSLISETTKSKAFQVLFYAYLYNSHRSYNQNIEAGIFSMRSISEGFIKLILPDNRSITDSLQQFEEIVLSLVSQVSDKDQAFVQTEDERRCRYCDYKNICNRSSDNNF